jgi:threonylcarbamoyladenosine tRNA methylthiotransferase MtaB
LSLIAARPKTPLGSYSFHSTPHNIIRTESGRKIKHKNPEPSQVKLPQLTSFRGQTRAFLKVQDGCDGYCSYCIIPKTRPIVRSKAPEAALREAQVLVEAGHKEIVLTGICLGAYGWETVRRRTGDGPRSEKLAELLEKIAEIPGLARIRLSSLGPNDVTPGLLDVFCENRNVMPHLHLSLQSGSESVLRKMCRQYTPDDFRATVEAVRSRLDRPAITTDIIVGFPGETDSDFKQTVALVKEVGFARIHVFTFSPRKGTAAVRIQGAVDKRVMKERSTVLQQLDKESGRDFRAQFVGGMAEVLLEGDDELSCGRSERYFMVRLRETAVILKKNTLVRVKLTGNSVTEMIGQALTTI